MFKHLTKLTQYLTLTIIKNNLEYFKNFPKFQIILSNYYKKISLRSKLLA